MNKTCIICNKSFHVKPSQFSKRVCCSKSCQKQHYKIKMIGYGNPNYKSEKSKTADCPICGSIFYPKYKTYNPKIHCSDKCYRASISIRKKGVKLSLDSLDSIRKKAAQRKEESQNYKLGVHIKCICECGSKKDPKAKQCIKCFHSRIKRKPNGECKICNSPTINRTYCSKECHLINRRRISKGAKNPNWKGGVKSKNQYDRNTIEYKTWRKSVFERDKYTCRNCGQIGGNLHCHHIKSFSKYPELRTEVSNGLTLCMKCHNLEHPQYDFEKSLLKANTKNLNH